MIGLGCMVGIYYNRLWYRMQIDVGVCPTRVPLTAV